MHFKRHLFLYTFVPLIVFLALFSYHRFIQNNDYLVTYEGACDEGTQSCFIGCEDEECTEEYYYSEITKYAADVYEQCGSDITDCEESNVCLASDRECSIEYCDPEIDAEACEHIDAIEALPENEQEEQL